MKIFISWSGQLSKELGEIFYNWIPGVLQHVKPYFTPDDVEKGARWNSEIARELQESQVGVLILTRENLTSSWVMFEAGALSKQMDKSRICPILFGIENTDLIGPLVQFQATTFNENDINKLVKTINNACDENKLEDNVLNNVFKMWWPKLKADIDSKMKRHKERPDVVVRSDRDLIEEILSLSRISATRTHTEPMTDLNPAAFEDLQRYYNDLKIAVDNQDFEKINQSTQILREPIDYLLDQSGIAPRRPRVLRPTKIVRSFASSEEPLIIENIDTDKQK